MPRTRIAAHAHQLYGDAEPDVHLVDPHPPGGGRVHHHARRALGVGGPREGRQQVRLEGGPRPLLADEQRAPAAYARAHGLLHLPPDFTADGDLGDRLRLGGRTAAAAALPRVRRAGCSGSPCGPARWSRRGCRTPRSSAPATRCCAACTRPRTGGPAFRRNDATARAALTLLGALARRTAA